MAFTESIALSDKLEIAKAYARLHKKCASDAETFALMQARLDFSATTMRKYKNFKIELEEIGQGGKRLEAHYIRDGEPQRVDGVTTVSGNGSASVRLNDPKPHFAVKKSAKLTKTRTELFITDVHLPFHCKASYELVLEVAREYKPDILYLNGDFIDAYSVSQWDKDPKVSEQNNIQHEFDCASEKLKELKSILPDADFYYKDGNHEDRFNRFLNKHAPQLRALRSLSVKSQLQLDAMEIQHIDQNEQKRIGNLFHLHGHELKFGGQNAPVSALRKMFSNVIFGHIHRQQSAIMRKYDGDNVGAWSIGCLADFQQDYVHFAETWSQGFAIVEYLPSGLFHVDSINIIKAVDKKICKVQGNWYEQRIV